MSSKYEIWLFADGDKSKLALPVLPERLSLDYGMGMSTFNIDSLGEIPVKSDRRARRISFSSIFPVEKLSGDNGYALVSPKIYVDIISSWAEKGKLLRLNVVGANIKMYCLIESFKVHEQGGDVGTRHYSISFVEHRQVKMKKIDLSSRGGRVDNRETASTYTVKSGDWLMKIARDQLGSSGRYMEIYNLNRDILKSPDLIYPGQVLKLPK